MVRKLSFAALAVAALGLVALSPSTASAGWHGKGWYGHGWGYNHAYVGGPVYSGYHSCWVKRWIDTPYGPRLKKVYVCY